MRARRRSNRMPDRGRQRMPLPSRSYVQIFATDGYAEMLGLGSVTIAGDQNAIWSAGAFALVSAVLTAVDAFVLARVYAAPAKDPHGEPTVEAGTAPPVTKQKSRTKFTWRKKGEPSSKTKGNGPDLELGAAASPLDQSSAPAAPANPFISGTPPANPFLAQRA